MTQVDVIAVLLAMVVKKRGGRKVIVLPDGTLGNPAPWAKIDNTLVKLTARAFRWQRLLANVTFGSLDEIAKAGKGSARDLSAVWWVLRCWRRTSWRLFLREDSQHI